MNAFALNGINIVEVHTGAWTLCITSPCVKDSLPRRFSYFKFRLISLFWKRWLDKKNIFMREINVSKIGIQPPEI